jgi:hypothetical protein
VRDISLIEGGVAPVGDGNEIKNMIRNTMCFFKTGYNRG